VKTKAEHQKTYYQKHKEEVKARKRVAYHEHKEEHKAVRRVYYQKHKEQIRAHKKITYQEHKEEYQIRAAENNKQLKMIILQQYSGIIPHCAYCGIDDMDVLCVDHIDGGGNKHRKAFGLHSGGSLYRWLIKNGYPKGYQVLCFNCNHKKRIAQRL